MLLAGADSIREVILFPTLRPETPVGLLYVGAEGFLAVPGLGELLVPKAVGGVAAPSAPSARAA